MTAILGFVSGVIPRPKGTNPANTYQWPVASLEKGAVSTSS